MIASMKRSPGESAGASADADASADHSRYRENCLLANIETLGMAGKTLENVLAALSRGKGRRLPTETSAEVAMDVSVLPRTEPGDPSRSRAFSRQGRRTTLPRGKRGEELPASCRPCEVSDVGERQFSNSGCGPRSRRRPPMPRRFRRAIAFIEAIMWSVRGRRGSWRTAVGSVPRRLERSSSITLAAAACDCLSIASCTSPRRTCCAPVLMAGARSADGFGHVTSYVHFR